MNATASPPRPDRIVVVDDDARIRDLLRRYLTQEGFEVMLACDFAYAVPKARFALTEVTLGIMPGAGGTQLLPRAVGERRAREILLTGRPFTAAQAFEWGALNGLCEPEALLPSVLEIATTIAGNAPLSVRQGTQRVLGA